MTTDSTGRLRRLRSAVTTVLVVALLLWLWPYASYWVGKWDCTRRGGRWIRLGGIVDPNNRPLIPPHYDFSCQSFGPTEPGHFEEEARRARLASGKQKK